MSQNRDTAIQALIQLVAAFGAALIEKFKRK
jgi:hypothetical protein